MIVAIVSLTNCKKETLIEKPIDKTSFSLIANLTETKTTISGYDVSWEAGDAMNVFYESTAAEGTYTPTSAAVSKFITTAGDGIFTPSSGSFVAPASGTNNWYVFYPYNSYLTTPNNTSAGRSTISSNQTQSGNDNTSHLAALCTMAGKASSVAYNAVPSITMKQLASVICVNVTNNTASPVTVSKVSIDNTDDGDGISGQYYIKFLDPENPVYTNHSASSEVQLTVSGGSAIAAGGNADFYLAVKPFTLNSGKNLSVTVTLSDEKAQTTTRNFLSNVDFLPGKVKTINFNLDNPVAVSYDFTSITELKDLSFATSQPGDSYSGTLTGAIVTYVNGKTAYIEDGDEGIMIFMDSHGLTAGDQIDGPIDVTGYKYNGLLELTNISYASATITPDQSIPVTNVTDLSNLTAALTYSGYESRRVRLANMTVTAAFGGSDKDGVITDGANSYNIRSQVNTFEVFEEGAVLTFVGYPAIYNSTYQFALWEAPTVITDSPNLRFANAAPSVTVGNTVTNAATSAKGSAGTISYLSSNESIATVNSSGVITGVAAGTATITASITAASGFCAGVATCEVTVSSASGYSWTLAAGDLGNSAEPAVSKTAEGLTWTLTPTWSGDSYFANDATKGVQIGSGAKPVRTYVLSTSGLSTKTITNITVNASTANSATATISVTVNGDSVIDQSLTNTATNYTSGTISKKGSIVITLSQPTTNKALYLKSISIAYTD